MIQVPVANIINHIGLVLDASGSMARHARNLIQVADSQIKHLAQRSQELDQETRISVWTFADRHLIKCVVWDKDVLRLPSIANFYRADGNTAFVDATLRAIDDLSETPERYGDHSFLLYVLTDGAENNSVARADALQRKLKDLKDHWTVAALVPDMDGVHEAKKFGFPAGNVQIWDTTARDGVVEVGNVIRAATDAYMTARASGLRSTTGLFSTDMTAVNAKTIQQTGLVALARDKYMLIHIPTECDGVRIDDFTRDKCHLPYVVSKGFYQLSKTETIQPSKQIAIVEKGPGGQVYVGRDARTMIGLPDMTVRVRPDYNPDFSVFVQSTSINRKLVANTKYLYLL